MTITQTMNYGVGGPQVYDFVYCGAGNTAAGGVDSEQQLPRFSPLVGGTYTAGTNGYILLNISSITWTSTAGSLDYTSYVYLDLDVSGFDPVVMTLPTDSTGVPLQHYRITSPTGSIVFSAGTNPAKYVWAVRNGQPLGAALNDDLTFTACRLVASIQQNNDLTSGQNVIFSIAYTLSFVSLDSAISGATFGSTANLSVDTSKNTYLKNLTTSAFTSLQSGYVLFVGGSITTTSLLPIRTNDFVPQLDDDAPQFYATLHDGSTLISQYCARFTRTKIWNTSPKFVIWPVNQGKIGVQGNNLDSSYELVDLKLDRGNSDDVATVALYYSITTATV